VRRIIEEQYGRVRALLASQEDILREAAQTLLNKETISGEELKAIVNGNAAQRAAGQTSDVTVH
jgi:cell division protease FtsH